MKAFVSEWYTDIFQTEEEVKTLCKPGAGADTCIWILMGVNGWECSSKHRISGLVKRWKDGDTSAKRDGCDKVNNFNPAGLMGEHEI